MHPAHQNDEASFGQPLGRSSRDDPSARPVRWSGVSFGGACFSGGVGFYVLCVVARCHAGIKARAAPGTRRPLRPGWVPIISTALRTGTSAFRVRMSRWQSCVKLKQVSVGFWLGTHGSIWGGVMKGSCGICAMEPRPHSCNGARAKSSPQTRFAYRRCCSRCHLKLVASIKLPS